MANIKIPSRLSSTPNWSTYDTGVVPEPMAWYANKNNTGSGGYDAVSSVSITNSGKIIFNNTLEYDIPSQTFEEVEIDINPQELNTLENYNWVFFAL